MGKERVWSAKIERLSPRVAAPFDGQSPGKVPRMVLWEASRPDKARDAVGASKERLIGEVRANLAREVEAAELFRTGWRVA